MTKLLVPALLLVGCGGGRFAASDSQRHEDGGGAVETGASTLDQRSPKAAPREAGDSDGRATLPGKDGSGWATPGDVDGGSPDGTLGSGGASSSGGSSAGGASTGGVASSGGAASSGGSDGGASIKCLTDLSGVGTGDFRIAFTITTTFHGNVALLSQRIGCDQSSMLWSTSLNYNGHVQGSTADGMAGHWATTAEANSVVDGSPHQIVFARTSGKIWISRDGVIDSVLVDDSYPLDTLPPLRIGTNDCSDFLSAQTAGITISNVCISR